MNRHETIEKSVLYGRYIAAEKCTIRQAAKFFAVSKSTVHKHVTAILSRENPQLYTQVKSVLEYNKAVRHIRGGETTKLKYQRGFYKMKIVYICSPYAGNVEENTERARRHCRFAYDEGMMPIASHLLYPQFLDDSIIVERKMGMHFAFVLLGKCDEMWVFGSYPSDGMLAEIEVAKERDIPIRYFDEV